jgi:hypothetical protein
VVVLPGLQGQQTHQVQAVDMMRIVRKRLLATELSVEMAARLHMPEAEFMERSGARAVVTFGGLVRLTFTRVHIGAFRPPETERE